MRKKIWGVLVIAGTALAVSTCATDDKMEAKMDWGKYQVGELRSGYTYATPETRAMQDDDFVNPAMLWVDDGDVIWNTVDGAEGKSCATCHSDASDSMKGVATVYPKFDKKLGKMISLEQQFNVCRTERMKAKPWKWESHEMLSVTSYVRTQSRGMIMNVAIDGPTAPFFEKGKAFYNQRRGLLDMACANCHVDYAGGQVRANILTQGQSNGFPTYRLKWQKPGSIHRRFRGCNKQVRSTPYGYGSDEYVNLELFLAWRGNGLPVETPAVRN
jgi:sulfur-oxidizing protein SoxA